MGTDRWAKWDVVLFAGGCWAAYKDGNLVHEAWSADDVITAIQEMTNSKLVIFLFSHSKDDDPSEVLSDVSIYDGGHMASVFE